MRKVGPTGVAIEDNPGKFSFGLLILPVMRILLGFLKVESSSKDAVGERVKVTELEQKWSSGEKKT
jgi:hypothetical protein